MIVPQLTSATNILVSNGGLFSMYGGFTMRRILFRATSKENNMS